MALLYLAVAIIQLLVLQLSLLFALTHFDLLLSGRSHGEKVRTYYLASFMQPLLVPIRVLLMGVR